MSFIPPTTGSVGNFELSSSHNPISVIIPSLTLTAPFLISSGTAAVKTYLPRISIYYFNLTFCKFIHENQKKCFRDFLGLF